MGVIRMVFFDSSEKMVMVKVNDSRNAKQYPNVGLVRKGVGKRWAGRAGPMASMNATLKSVRLHGFNERARTATVVL